MAGYPDEIQWNHNERSDHYGIALHRCVCADCEETRRRHGVPYPKGFKPRPVVGAAKSQSTKVYR